MATTDAGRRFPHGSLTLFRVRGIPVRAHWTLLVIVPYIAVMFAGFFPRVANTADVRPEHIFLPPLFWGALLAVGLFASVAVHELAHVFVAVRAGGRVRDITLMLIGGVSSIERLPPGRGHEALMAFAGPATSLVVGALLLVVHGQVPHHAGDGSMGLYYLGNINVSLGLFNLVPAFPMDGGRVLRSLLELRLDRRRATAIAASVGRVVAIAMGLAGLWTGSFLLILIALFVYSGAGAERNAEEARHALAGMRVGDVMSGHVPSVSLESRLAGLPAKMRDAERTELIVVDDAERPVGVVRAADLARIAAGDRGALRVGDLADVVEHSAVIVPKDASAADAFEQAAAAGVEYVLVVDAAVPGGVGLIGRRELEDALVLRSLERAGRAA